jgi:hypothetical protein
MMQTIDGRFAGHIMNTLRRPPGHLHDVMLDVDGFVFEGENVNADQ